MYTEEAVGTGDNDFVHIAQTVHRQYVQAQFAIGVLFQALERSLLWSLGAVDQFGQALQRWSFDEAVYRYTVAELLAHLQQQT